MSEQKFNLRGRSFTGVVASTKMHKTAIIEWQKKIRIPKFDRFTFRRKKLAVHVPDKMDLKVGDIVKISETRPISKTKNFVIVEKLGFRKEHIIKEESKDNADQSLHKSKEENVSDTVKDTKKSS